MKEASLFNDFKKRGLNIEESNETSKCSATTLGEEL